ncbi:hypothetical protein [Micromonospora sp. NPDC049645]|uniref:hypothetical protein n=1 Tax=Micromonospora sp. NPDC049645 TaxID=3155508 RepID=UPI0034417C6E
MVSFTPHEGWRYPLITEKFQRSSIEQLAGDIHSSFDGWDHSRIAALQRISGILGVTVSAGTFTTSNYMSWNVDHLSAFGAGGLQVSATQGPTLPHGLYRVDLRARITASAALTSVLYEVERGGTVVARRRTNSTSQLDARISIPVFVPAGGPQLVRIRVTPTGSGASVTYGRVAWDATPRFSWSLIASP